MVRSRVAAGPGTAVVTSSTMPVSSTTSTPSTIVGPQAAADRAVGPTGADEPQREIRWPGLLAIVSLCAITGGAGVRRRRGHPKISG
jgi:hypothetical protein